VNDQHHRLIGNRMRCTSGWRRPTSPSPHPLMAATGSLPGVVSIPNELRATVRDQSTIGRCTGEAIVEVVEGVALRDGVQVDLSANAVYWWERRLDGSPASSDTGSTIATGVTVAQTFGVPTLQTWSDDRDFTLEPDTNAVLDASKRKAQLVFALPNVAAIKASIRDGFSVALGFSCPDDLFDPTTLDSGNVNFYDDDSHYKGDGHAVSIVAVDDSRVIGNCTGALLFNAHWGTSVGLDGLFWLPYSYLLSGRASDAHTIRLLSSI
jgi:hypothetical protein